MKTARQAGSKGGDWGDDLPPSHRTASSCLLACVVSMPYKQFLFDITFLVAYCCADSLMCTIPSPTYKLCSRHLVCASPSVTSTTDDMLGVWIFDKGCESGCLGMHEAMIHDFGSTAPRCVLALNSNMRACARWLLQTSCCLMAVRCLGQHDLFIAVG